MSAAGFKNIILLSFIDRERERVREKRKARVVVRLYIGGGGRVEKTIYLV
jgi:hypothetical protein